MVQTRSGSSPEKKENGILFNLQLKKNIPEQSYKKCVNVETWLPEKRDQTWNDSKNWLFSFNRGSSMNFKRHSDNVLIKCYSLHIVFKFGGCPLLTIDIFGSGWYIFLKSFVEIPGMLVHLFQIILNFFYVSQSVILLTFLLKLHKYWDIASSG